MAQTPLQIAPLSRESLNFIGGGGNLHPFFVGSNWADGHRVFGERELCLVAINSNDIPARVTVKAPTRYDGVRLVDKVLTVSADGVLHGVMIDPAYAGNIIDITGGENLLQSFLPSRAAPSGSTGSVPVYFLLFNGNFSLGLDGWQVDAPGASGVTADEDGARLSAVTGAGAATLFTHIQNGDVIGPLIFEFDIAGLDGDGTTKPRFGSYDDAITWTALSGSAAISDPVDGTVALSGNGHYKLKASAVMSPSDVLFSIAAPASGDPNVFTLPAVAAYPDNQEIGFYVTFSEDTAAMRGYEAGVQFTVPTAPGAVTVDVGLFVIASDTFLGLFGVEGTFTPGATVRTLSGAFGGVDDAVAMVLHFKYRDADGELMSPPPVPTFSAAIVQLPEVGPTDIIPGHVQFHCDLPNVDLLAVDLAGDQTPPVWRPEEA